MSATAATSPSPDPAGPQSHAASAPASATPPRLPILAERWPALGNALSRYAQGTAESYSRMAYDAVISGLIRYSDRQRLARAAADLGIRPFDAQLLIACAVRQWTLDRHYDATPSRRAPALSYEYRAWGRAWTRVALIVGTAAILDCIILWKWLAL